MHWIDWLILLVPLCAVVLIALYTQRYVKGVADFLVGGRVAGRYVLTVASAEAGMGLITIVAWFEAHYKSGFAYGFWAGFTPIIMIIVTLTGFAIYRYRETRAMTMAQFFEIRYSKAFRVYAGGLSAFAGIFNYGIFPAVGARFLIYYLDLPTSLSWGGWSIPTLAVMMFCFLTFAVVLVTLGGQLTVMTSDAVQGLLSYPMYVAVFFAVIYLFSYEQMETALLDRPPGKSMMNPFDTYALRDFNVFFVLVGIVGAIYNRLSWQGSQGYNAAAINAHEQKMAGVLSAWRGGFDMMAISFITIAAFTYMHHSDFSSQAATVTHTLTTKTLEMDFPHVLENGSAQNLTAEEAQAHVDALDGRDKQVFATTITQMTVPVAVRTYLPVGITGAFCAIMVFLLISTDTTYLHSWSSIVVQDLIVPFRKNPLKPRTQMWMIRTVIILVALYAFIFSLFFTQITYILMFFALTGAVYLGGAGACILGGLYWKRGTTAGAWSAMIVGSSIAVVAFTLQNSWANYVYPWIERRPAFMSWSDQMLRTVSDWLPGIAWEMQADRFPINGQEVYFFTMLAAIAAYVGVSLLTCREPFNLDRMLHRGKYRAVDDQRAPGEAGEVTSRRIRNPADVFRLLVGIDDQYTRGDRILAWSVFGWTLFGLSLWLLKVVWNLIDRWPDTWWVYWWWYWNMSIGILIGVVTTIWFTWGTTTDLFAMFKRLKAKDRDRQDDGRVIGHVNADEVEQVRKIEASEKSDG